MMVLLVIVWLLAGLQHSTADVRLVNSDSDHQGTVEVLINRRWGKICGDDFEVKDANVICKTLGYFGALNAHDSIYQGRGDIWKLNCTGEEDSIFGCDIVKPDHCNRKKNVHCQTSPPVRLTCPYDKTCNNIARKHGPDPGECTPSVHVEGIVEVYYNERWWPVSADEWDDEDVNVVCGQLGYPVSFGTVSKLSMILFKGIHIGREKRKQFRKSHWQRVTLQGLNCTGTERDISLCPHHGWGPFDNPGGKVATARCGFHPHPSCDGDNNQSSYRLRAGVLPWMGRAEVLYNNTWGTVCDDGFDDNSANVLCRSLGYGNVVSISKRSGYGRGIGRIWLSDLQCDGTESHLNDCDHLPWGNTSLCYDHRRDVGVKCSVPDIHHGQKKPVQFVSTANNINDNYVEVAVGNHGYGMVCYDEVDVMMSSVLCRSQPDPKFLVTHQSRQLAFTGQRYRGKFVCKGNELNVRECDMQFVPVSQCDNGDLLINCDNRLPDLVPILSNFEDSLKNHPEYSFEKIKRLQCALGENCLASDAVGLPNSAVRSLLRFDLLTMNYGLSDFTPVLHRSQWIWHSCHRHYHSIEVFAEYNLLSLNGTKVAEGHKASFCLEDTQCDFTSDRHYFCSRRSKQGISENCGDLYRRYLDCQWIDITGVPEGIYSIQVKVNPTQLVQESDYSNNAIQCTVSMTKKRLDVISCSRSGHDMTTDYLPADGKF